MSEGVEATAVFGGGFTAEVSARGHRVSVDEPVELGGKDAGFMPTELLCAALASCFALAMGHVARKRDIEVPGLEVNVRAERAGRELRYERLTIEARAHMEAEALADLVTRAERFCWVSNTLSSGVTFEYRSRPLE
jgi:putative redox protein